MQPPEPPPSTERDPSQARPVQIGSAGQVPFAPELPRARPAGRSDPLAIGERRLHVAIDVLLVLGLFIVLVVAIGFVPPLQNPPPTAPTDEATQRSPLQPLAVVFTGGVAVLLVLGAARVHRQPWATLGFRSANVLLDVGLGVAACLGFLVCLVAATTALWLADPAMFEVIQESGDRLQAMLPPMSPVTILLLSAWVGVHEELLFRGFLLPRLRRLFGSWTAAVVAGSVFFALLHGYEGAIAVVAIFFLSLVLSVLFVWRRSLLPVVVGHFLFDLLQLTLLQMRSRMFPSDSPAPAWAWWS